MTQVLPQVQVYQEFTLVPTAVIIPLRAFIFGPHFNVRSYEKAKTTISLGAYDAAADHAYGWPGRQAGEIVDQSFTRLFIDDAWIRYFNYAGLTSVVSSVSPNILRLASGGWQALTGFARNALVPRDVAIGDAVRVTDPSDSSKTLTARVRSVARETVASSHDANGTVSSGNKTTTSASSTPVSAPGGSPFSAAITTTGFKPYKVGLTSDRYTFEVTVAGGSGVAKMAVTTDSGLDAEYDVTITTGGALTVGDLGLQITFTGAGVFNVGDKWVFDVVCDYTATVGGDLTFTGTYTGLTTTSYIVTVTEGGVVSTDTPKVSVRTADGSDAGGPYDAAAAAFAIGSLGLSLAFGVGTFLSKGDSFSAVVTAASLGRVRDLVLDQSLPATLILADAAVQVSAVRNQEILANRYNQPNVKNWTQAATAITVKSGILSYSTESDLNGYPIVAGTVYAGYRALAQTYASDVQTVTDVSALSTLFSDLTPENPLAYGLKKALENANGTSVKFIGVATNDLAGFTTAVNKTLEREDVYSFVPMTKDRSVLEMVVGHVKQQSTPEKGRWRIAWVTEANATTKQIVGSSVTPFLGTIANDPADGAGTYRLVTCSTATFITDGVVAGDTLRYHFAVDSVGAQTYETDIVDSVISETQLKVLTGPAAPVTVAEKIEIWRNLSAAAQVDELATLNSYGTRRAYNVLAGNQNDADGYSNVDDMFLASAFAGLRSGVLAHQGLTNVELSGFSRINWTMLTLTGADRDTLMNAGYWVVQQNTEGAGEVYCRKQISTDLTDLNTTEQSVTTNVDSVSYYLKQILAPYIGRTNNVDTVQNLIRGDIEAAFQVFFNNATPTLGSQLLDGTVITDLRPHATLRDRLVVEIALVIPYPLNNIDVYLVV